MKILKLFISTLLALTLSGCAKILLTHQDSLIVESNPPGATIKTVDGQIYGTAPYNLKPENKNAYELTLSKEGYEDYSLEIRPWQNNLVLFADAMLLCIPCIVDLPSKYYLNYPKDTYTAELIRLKPKNDLKKNQPSLVHSSRLYINVQQLDIKIKDKLVLGKVNATNKRYNVKKQHLTIGKAENWSEDICGEFNNYLIDALQCGTNKFSPPGIQGRIIPEKQLYAKMIVDKFSFNLKTNRSSYDGDGNIEVRWQLMDPNHNMEIIKESKLSTNIKYTGTQIRYLFSELLKKVTDEYILNENIYELIASKELSSPVQLKTEEVAISKTSLPIFEKTKNLISHCIKAVVTIKTNKGFGSGVVISNDGFIVTNSHVVNNNTDVNVKFNNGFSIKGIVLKNDPINDLALIKVEAADLTPLNLYSEDVEIGEDIIAIGTPADISFEQTVTKGIISGKRVIDDRKFYRTDVSMNAGNSGGPLINDKGEIVGIITMKMVSNGIE
ncbi:MAG TPA: trypsin-like peptidase domain-containing protein, partial [Saprospiraceae bacterium]|nr:trypsin-like peptidase domain-containing protein [Saprospiraceae bacterium]